MAWDDYIEGMKFSWVFRYSKAEMKAFIELSGDSSPVHTNNNYAVALGFSGPILHGALLAAQLSNFIGKKLPDQNAMTTGFNIDFLRPSYVDKDYIFKAVLAYKFESYKILEFNFEILDDIVKLSKGSISAKWNNPFAT